MAVDLTFGPKTYETDNGDTNKVAAGGKLEFETGACLILATEVVTATNVIAATESGATFFLNNAAGFASTLPAPAAGLTFTFVVTAAVTSVGHTVVCAAAGTLIKGHVLSSDLNSASDSDFGTTGEGTLTFVSNKAVAGDKAVFCCDGTNWFVQAACTVFDAITIS